MKSLRSSLSRFHLNIVGFDATSFEAANYAEARRIAREQLPPNFRLAVLITEVEYDTFGLIYEKQKLAFIRGSESDRRPQKQAISQLRDIYQLYPQTQLISLRYFRGEEAVINLIGPGFKGRRYFTVADWMNGIKIKERVVLSEF